MANKDEKKFVLAPVPFEINQLRYFVAAAEQQSFSQAANLLHVSQPLISQQIADLERQLGVELFMRNRRNVTLTSAGSVMLEEARKILAHISDSKHTITRADLGIEPLGRITIALEQLFERTVFTQAVLNFRKQHPSVEIQPSIMRMSEIMHGLSAGSISLGMCILPANLGADFEYRELMRDQLCFVASNQFIHSQKPDCFSWLAECLPCCLLERDYRGMNSTVQICMELGLTPEFLFFPDLENVLIQVESGTGFSILPRRVIDTFSSKHLALVPLDGFADAEISLSAVWSKKEHTALIDLFLNEFIGKDDVTPHDP